MHHYPTNGDSKSPGAVGNQEPACGGATGVYISESESEKTETTVDKPTLRNVKLEDLRNPARLLDFHAQADEGLVLGLGVAELGDQREPLVAPGRG
jgi:hypothetical protein